MEEHPELALALRELLGELHGVSQEHGELQDTECRERVVGAVLAAFVQPRAGYVLPEQFGLYEPDGNARVRAALQRYISRAEPYARRQGLSAQARLHAFQNPEVMDPEGCTPDDYFGWLDHLPAESA